MNKLLNIGFDKDFDEIEGLIWYPWIGKDYADKDSKVLVIGESQYAVDENNSFCKETFKAFSKNKEISREYFFEAIKGSKETKHFYKSLFKTYFEEKEITTSHLISFASNVSFYHFYQTVDKKVSGNKRNKVERLISWRIWDEVVNIIKPDLCIMHGISMYKYFDAFCNVEKEYKWKDVDSGFYEKGQQPIKAEYKLNNGKVIDLIILKHPSSRGYSAKLWRGFLHSKFSKLKNNI